MPTQDTCQINQDAQHYRIVRHYTKCRLVYLIQPLPSEPNMPGDSHQREPQELECNGTVQLPELPIPFTLVLHQKLSSSQGAVLSCDQLTMLKTR